MKLQVSIAAAGIALFGVVACFEATPTTDYPQRRSQAGVPNSQPNQLPNQQPVIQQPINQGPVTPVNYQPPTPYNYPPDYNDPNLAPNKHLLVWNTNPDQEATVSWSLPAFNANDTHMIYVSERQQNGVNLQNYEMNFQAQETGMAGLCQLPLVQGRITGLKPNTTYFFVTVTNGQKSREMHFVTAPQGQNVSFKLFSGGDSRSDPNQRITMNSQMSQLMTQDPNYIALIHGGDFVETGSDCNQWDSWLDNHQRTMTTSLRVLPVVATFGNHESGGEPQFTYLFGDPLGGGKFYFNTKIGALDLIILNSEISVEGEQRQWLTQTLQQIAPQSMFLMAGYHRPAWPAQKSPGSTTAWVPLFEQYQMDLVFESDGHVLKQTCPIFNNACNQQQGVIYVGEGGLGVSQREAAQSGQWYFQGGYALGQHHIQTIDFQMQGQQSFINYAAYYNGMFNYPITLNRKVR